MAHTLPPLPYDYNALEPYIDEQTMRLHHDLHHKSYVDGLNAAEAKLAEAREKGDFAAVKHLSRECAFHGSGHFNHVLFWETMHAPAEKGGKGGGKPNGDLADAIARSFGDYDKFQAQFLAASNTVQASGWGVLAYRPQVDDLVILQSEQHQNLSQWGVVPILMVDVWEHAYYLKYQNRRPEYTKAFMQVVHWDAVAEKLKKATGAR
ncbi:MAG: superoxide dismutase [Candidatus Sumerlaeia bacterium]|nr:superoxide dismutase [Candidatus Sumerlaeia bacterium]